MAKPKYLSSILALRKAYPKSKLGFREKSILNATGAKVTKARDYPGTYKVKSGNKYFGFTHGKSGYPDFTVVI